MPKNKCRSMTRQNLGQITFVARRMPIVVTHNRCAVGQKFERYDETELASSFLLKIFQVANICSSDAITGDYHAKSIEAQSSHIHLFQPIFARAF